MNSREMVKAIGTFLLASALVCLPHLAMGDGESIDDLLQGFEEADSEAAAAENDESIDDLLDGFEESDAGAAEDDESSAGMDELLDGFEETPAVSDETQADKEWLPDWLSVDGYFKLGSTWNVAHEKPMDWRAILRSKGISLPAAAIIPASLTGKIDYLRYILDGNETDWRGLSRLRAELQTDLEARLPNSWRAKLSGKGFYDIAYGLNGRSGYTNEVLSSYESEIELREAWVQGKVTENLDIKAGRQIVVWGKSDAIRITDVLNPLDMREPGMTDLEDIRIPLTMTRLDYYLGNWSFTGIAVHEILFNKNPEFGSDFYPSMIPMPHEDIPSSFADHTEFGLAVNGFFSGWDIAFYFADIYQDDPRLRIDEFRTVSLPSPLPSLPIPVIELGHERLQMFGFSFNIVAGSWLLKSEAAHIQGFQFFWDPGEEYRRTDVMLGVEYSGLEETVVTLEAANRHYHHYRDELGCFPDHAQENEVQWVFSVSRNFFNERLNITVRAFVFDTLGQDGAMERLTVTYDMTDAVQLTGGFILYQSGDVYQFGDNDRVYLEIKYSF